MSKSRLTHHLEARWQNYVKKRSVPAVHTLIVHLVISRLMARESVTPILYSANWTMAVMDVRDDKKWPYTAMDWGDIEDECENYALILFDADFADFVEDVRAPIEEEVA